MKKKKLKTLSTWDWETLVAAWRYYEYRQTIASAGFPCDIIERFFRGDYTEESCRKIARQFAEVDHGLRGEEDWTGNKYLHDCDKIRWTKFYAFCKAYNEGFTSLKLKHDDGRIETMEAFYCNYMKRWYPVKMYISNPYIEQYIDESHIIKGAEA